MSIAQFKMFRIVSYLELLMTRVKKFQKRTEANRYVDNQTFKRQDQLFGVINQLEEFATSFEKANAAADELSNALEDFDLGVGSHIKALKSSKRALKHWN